MNEMVERIVKVLYDTSNLAIGVSPNKNHMAVWNGNTGECVADGFADDKAASEGGRAYRARAVISALREPTEAMMMAAAPALEGVNNLLQIAQIHGVKLEWKNDEPPLKHAWRAMIDAAALADP